MRNVITRVGVAMAVSLVASVAAQRPPSFAGTWMPDTRKNMMPMRAPGSVGAASAGAFGRVGLVEPHQQKPEALPQMKPITATTGEPDAPLGIARQIAPGTEEEYQRRVADRIAKDATFVPMTRKPVGLSASARFGSDFLIDGRNYSYVLDGDEQKGYVLYVDLNANGDLTDDPPQQFEKQNGFYSCLLRTVVHDLNKDPRQTYPVVLKLELANLLAPGHTERQLYLSIHAITVRRGVAHVGQRDVLFSIQGRWGLYDGETNEVYFDLNGDGQLDGADPRAMPRDSPERFLVSDKYVTIGETSYEFSVDRYGRNVTLTPLAERLPPRATLLPNSSAPDFAFTGIDGNAHKLSDYRGKVVLLDFWGTWCGPCVAAAPKLAEAYERDRAREFEIIGIDTSDSEEKLQQFLTEKNLTWIQTREEQTGPIQRLYRVRVWPSYFLIGKDGTIVAKGVGDQNLLAEMEKLIAIRQVPSTTSSPTRAASRSSRR
jgi:thiol-disulfide isomerase/thioredoxin